MLLYRAVVGRPVTERVRAAGLSGRPTLLTRLDVGRLVLRATVIDHSAAVNSRSYRRVPRACRRSILRAAFIS